MRIVNLSLLLAFAIGLASPAEAADTVYLVRHAEKMADGTSDPELTDEGKARACFLAGFFADKGLTHILSTDYQRTRQTAKPVAKSLGLEVEEYDPKHLPILAMMLENKPGTYLIIGHSNTTPEMIQLLGGEDIGPWDEKEYDPFYEVRIVDGVVATIEYQSAAECQESAE